MRIVQTIETGGPGGAEEILLHLCRSLRNLGHQAEALLLKEGWLAERTREAGIPTTVLPLARSMDRSFVTALARRLSDGQFDLVHSHEFTLAIYGRLACRRQGVAHVATVHGRNFVRGAKRRLACGLVLRPRGGCATVAVSRDLARHVAERSFPPLSPPMVIPNGVPARASLRPTPRNYAELLRLVAVGNLYTVKNHALLIRAVAELRREGLPVELDILGRGEQENELRELIVALDLGASVRLRGYRPDVADFLSAAHVFVSASLSEGMPLSFLEAMSHGLPVVASEVGGVSEIVQHGTHGLLFPCGALPALVDSIRRLAADDALRLRLGRNAVATVRKRFSVDSMVARYLDLYWTLLPQGAS